MGKKTGAPGAEQSRIRTCHVTRRNLHPGAASFKAAVVTLCTLTKCVCPSGNYASFDLKPHRRGSAGAWCSHRGREKRAGSYDRGDVAVMRVFRILMSIVVLACLTPLFSMVAAEVTARIFGCDLSLAATHPCMAFGTDIGSNLLTMGMMGWFLMTTLPVMLGVVILWIAVEIVRWFSMRRA
jgi:hypothetical protein